MALASCSVESSEYCQVLTEDLDAALAVFTPIVPDTHTTEVAQERLDLLDDAEPHVPADAEEDFSLWHDYMATATAELDSDPEGVLELGTSEEVLSAGHGLVKHYDEACMG